MSDSEEYVPRSEFESLKEEVERLKDELEARDAESNTPGLDHRDETVLEKIQEAGGAGPRETVQYYLHFTDISNRRTAKDRAKNLRNHPEFQEVSL